MCVFVWNEATVAIIFVTYECIGACWKQLITKVNKPEQINIVIFTVLKVFTDLTNKTSNKNTPWIFVVVNCFEYSKLTLQDQNRYSLIVCILHLGYTMVTGT